MGTEVTGTEAINRVVMGTAVMHTAAMDTACMHTCTHAHSGHAKTTGALLLNPLADWWQVPTPPEELSGKLIPA